MNRQQITVSGLRGLATTGLVGMLIACGGGGGGDDDDVVTSESVVARGVITQLGSIWVLGVEYETPNGNSYKNDDSTSTVADYKVGQAVRLRGRRNEDGISGIAEEVEYEAEIEGSASGGVINGITILMNTKTNTGEATLTGGGDLVDNNRYEVSGLWLDDTTLDATYIKDDDDGDDEDEIKGYAANVIDGVSISVHGITYLYAGTDIDDDNFVEVHFDPTTCSGVSPNIICSATEVELEDDFNDENEGQEAEFEGTVNLDPLDLASCPAGADFLIDTTCIDWDSVPSSGWKDGLVDESDMVQGLRAETEGHFDANRLLVAEEIKGRGNRVRIRAMVDSGSVGAGTFTVFDGIIQVTTQTDLTEYEGAVADFSSIMNNTPLEIKGIRTGPSSMMALHVGGESVAADEHELRAEVDLNGVDSGAGTITVMGVTSQADPGIELELSDVAFAGGLTAFLDLIDDDNIVNAVNGPRDVIEMRFDITTGVGSGGNPYTADEIEIEEEDD